MLCKKSTRKVASPSSAKHCGCWEVGRMPVFDSNCLYVIECLALVFVVAPCVLFAGSMLICGLLWCGLHITRRHAPAAAGSAAVRALPLLGHRPVPAVRPQHAKRFLQPRRKVARLMDILLSIIGNAVLAALLAAAYTAGVCAGKAAAHLDEDDEPKIYMDHTHGGED